METDSKQYARGRRYIGVALALAMACVAAPSAWAGAGDDAYIKQVTQQVGPASVGSAAVACGAGERAIAGGVGFRGVDDAVTVSGPLDETGLTANTDDGDVPRSWYSAILNFRQGAVTETYTFFAICSATSDATVQATQFDAPGNAFGQGSVSCPAGQRAISGGLGTTGSEAASRLALSGPLDESGLTANTDDGDVARTWYSAFLNFAGGGPYKVFVLCSPTSQATLQAEPATVGTGLEAAPQAICPGGTRAIGGGIGAQTFVSHRLHYSAPGPFDLAAPTIPGRWHTDITNRSGNAENFKAFAVCEGPTPPGPPPLQPTDPPAPPAPLPPGTGPIPLENPPLCRETAATIAGTEGPDTLVGTPGDDVIHALGGNDTVLASGGNDVACGGAGSDTVKGQAGADLLLGDAGKDVLKGGGDRDLCYGGRGKDSNAGCEKGRE